MNVLFVCEDNAALSIMAEAILRAVAPGHFTAYSAGCFPNGAVSPEALEFLEQHHLSVAGLRSKSLHAFRSSARASRSKLFGFVLAKALGPFGLLRLFYAASYSKAM